MSLHDDSFIVAQTSTYQEEVNRKILALECENALLSAIVHSKVINKTTGKKMERSLYSINTERQASCIQRYWIRQPRSNSNSFVFHSQQNKPNNDNMHPIPLLLSRQLVRG